MGKAFAVFGGGGTGGHLYPGVAVAEELVRRGYDRASIHFVAARRGVEAGSQATARFPTTLLPGRGLRREMSLSAISHNAEAIFGCAKSVAMALLLFAEWRPSVVVSLGGYASVAPVAAAAALRVPVVVVNVDAAPGVANRVAARLAVASAVGSPTVRLPRAVFTGVPVRANMTELERGEEARARARERLSLPAEAKVVAVSGGSLGARRLNEAVLGLVELWSGRPGIAVRHIIGRRDWPELGQRQVVTKGLVYQRVVYEDDMASFYQAADVAVQRAGASTVAELALAGVPSLLVPLPGSPGDHQGANAREMARAGGAIVVPDAEVDGCRLARELDGLLADPGRLKEMGEAARSLARPQAAAQVADLVEKAGASAR
jgi:UDP-N-acetylglucosamine--N-acetylmuramyl-(pentapeptide) pyrophosphoryl-undecaprenol N-acetylglucosamine transferase